MTETEIRRLINSNQAEYDKANDATKALLHAKNESLAKELDKLTGGQSTYDPATNRWNLSASTQGAVDRYLEQKDLVAGSAYGGYDAETDPAYSTLKKQYLREADRGVEDTLGAFAGMTGGIPSTAAVSAAQQTGDYYRGQLADRQVELGEQDYSRWLSDLDAQKDLLNIYAQEAQNSAESLAALGDFTAMGRLYGWTEAQIAEARNQWLAAQYSGGGGGGSSEEEKKETNGIGTVSPAAENYFNALVSTAVKKDGTTANVHTAAGQQEIKKTINAEVDAALKAGAITKAEANAIKKQYITKGYTY